MNEFGARHIWHILEDLSFGKDTTKAFKTFHIGITHGIFSTNQKFRHLE